MDTGPGPAGSEGDKTVGSPWGSVPRGLRRGGSHSCCKAKPVSQFWSISLFRVGRKRLFCPSPAPFRATARPGGGDSPLPGRTPHPGVGCRSRSLAPRGPAGGGARLQPAEPRDIKGKTRLRRLLSPGARSPQRCPETPAGSAEPGAAANGASRPGAPPPPAPSAGKTQQQQPGRAPAMRRLGGVTRRRVFQGPPRLAGGSEPGAETARSPPCTHPAAGARGPFPAAPTTAALRRLPPLA